MRLVVIGPGAIGCVIGSALVETGRDVMFCSRQNFERLVIRKRGEEAKILPAQVVTDPHAVKQADWVLLCVKAHQTASAAGWLRAATDAGTKIAVFQNGVEQRENVEPFAPEGSIVVPVVVDLPAKRTAPGIVDWHSKALATVQDNAAGREFCALFQGSFVDATATDDLLTRAWMKLCINAPGGAILALTRQTMSVFHKKGIADVARAILRECLAVGRAEGAKLDDGLIERQVAAFLASGPNEGNSLYADRMAGLRMEWDARNGVIVRKAAKHGIAVPVSAALVPLLAALDP
jgi:2-dehydropantoate 2-reductase